MQVSLLLTFHESLMQANNKRGPLVSLAPATESPTASSPPTSGTEAEPSLLFMTPPCLAHQKKGRLESWFIITLSFLGVMQISPPWPLRGSALVVSKASLRARPQCSHVAVLGDTTLHCITYPGHRRFVHWPVVICHLSFTLKQNLPRRKFPPR